MKAEVKLNLLFCGLFVWAMIVLPVLAGDRTGVDDERLIYQCIGLAKSSVSKGNQPFGALLVQDGKVIMTAENTVITDENTSHHAETNLISAVFREYGVKGLNGATLYTSCEPCPMCCGAIYMAGIDRVVYGLSAQRLSAISGYVNTLYARKLFALSERNIQVTGPVLEEAAALVMEDYLKTWKQPR